MKGILGPKRVLVVLLLVILNGVMGMATYGYLVPERTKTEQLVKQTKTQTTARRNEVMNLKDEYIRLQGDIKQYKELEARGFFGDQNRVLAQDMFDRMQNIAGLLKARYAISPGTMIDDPIAKEANYSIISSPIVVSIEALDDMDVYSFLKLLQMRFPGSIEITKFDLKRNIELSQPILRQIGTGTPIVLVNSTLSFNWRTMTPMDTPPADQGAQP